MAMNAVTNFPSTAQAPVRGEEVMSDGVIVLDSVYSDDGTVTDFILRDINSLAALQLGESPLVLTGSIASQVFTRTDLPVDMDTCITVAQTGCGFKGEAELRSASNALLRITISINPVPSGLVIVTSDVTEQRRVRADLERFAALVDHGRSLVGFITPDGKRAYLNRMGISLLGVKEIEPNRP